MQCISNDLRELFDFEARGDGTLQAGSGRPNPYGILFGGQLIAQVIAAAQTSVDDRPLHSLHLNFIKPGNPSLPIDFTVERLRDGHSFSTRLVRGTQVSAPLVTATASWLRLMPAKPRSVAAPRTQPPTVR